jgi:hypothetical protein
VLAAVGQPCQPFHTDVFAEECLLGVWGFKMRENAGDLSKRWAVPKASSGGPPGGVLNERGLGL